MKTISLIFPVLFFSACQESLSQRAAREAVEYTRKNCPTPVQNSTRTDSVVFDMATNTYHYYCSACGVMDNKAIIDANREKLEEGLRKSINETTGLKMYKKEGFNFAWTLRSDKHPETILFEKTFTPKEYDRQ